jgi:hypothetical protein
MMWTVGNLDVIPAQAAGMTTYIGNIGTTRGSESAWLRREAKFLKDLTHNLDQI